MVREVVWSVRLYELNEWTTSGARSSGECLEVTAEVLGVWIRFGGGVSRLRESCVEDWTRSIAMALYQCVTRPTL